jgi:hypothetical protein
VRDQVSHPYKTTDKVTVLYILILGIRSMEQLYLCHHVTPLNMHICPLAKQVEVGRRALKNSVKFNSKLRLLHCVNCWVA